ncbi:MAG: DUF4386 domain-containing protein [Acidimicrobiia bacterium]
MSTNTGTHANRTSTGDESTRGGSLRRYAIVAGVGYVALFVLGIFANFFVREGLIVGGDAAQTAANILESEGLFRVGMVSFLAIFVIDVVVAWALYVLFQKVNPSVSLMTAWFRIVYTVFLGVAVIFFYQALQLLSGSEFLSVFDAGQLEAQALLAADTFNSTWLIGLLVFGVHLVLLGWLVVKSSAPRILGYVLMVAGLAYMADTIAHTVLANYVDYENLFLVIVAVPSVIAEGWMGLWLLVKGGRSQPTA